MVVTKTKKKVTKVTKHKVTNNKTKKRNKNAQRGGVPISRPKSAPVTGRRKSAPLATAPLTSKETGDKPDGRKITSIPQLTVTANRPLTATAMQSPRMPSQKTPRKPSVSKQAQPVSPIDVSTFNTAYYEVIKKVNKSLIKPDSDAIKKFPNIINDILAWTKKIGQTGGTNYSLPIPKLTSSGLHGITFDEPTNQPKPLDGKYDVVIVGCSPEALYMSILLKLLMPTLTIVVLECGKNAQPAVGAAAVGAAADELDVSSDEIQPAREEDKSRALTNETMMSLKYIWANVQMEENLLSILNGISCHSSSRGNELLNNIYNYNGKLQQNVLNIFPSCFYTEDDISKEHMPIFPVDMDVTAKIQINILEFFLTRRAIELNVVILHNVAIAKMPDLRDYVGPNTLAIFNATGFFDILQETDNPVTPYKCIYGLTSDINLRKDGNTQSYANFNKISSKQFKLINKYGYYIALKDAQSASTTLNKFLISGNAEIKNCSNRYETVNPEPLKWYDDNRLHVPIISIGKSLRGKIIFEWNYLGFADCFIYGLLFKRIYDTTAPAAVLPLPLPPPPVSPPAAPAANTPPITQAHSASLLPPPPPPAPKIANNKAQLDEDAIKQQSKVESDNILNTALSNISKTFEDARKENARKEAEDQDTARQKAAAEEAAQQKAAAEAEEAARVKAAAEAEEAAQATAAAKAEEDVREKAAADVEKARLNLLAAQAARLQAKAAAEEVARAKLASEEAARAKLASEEAARAKLASEEAARAKLASEEAARAKQAAEAAAQAKAAADAEAARLQAAADAEAAAQAKAAADAEAAAQAKAAAHAEAAAQAKAAAHAEAAAQAKAAAHAETARLQAAADAEAAARLKAAAEAARQTAVADTVDEISLGFNQEEEKEVEPPQDTSTETREATIAGPTALEQVNATPTDNLEIALGTDAPTTDGDTLEITIEDEEKEEEKEDNAAETQTPQNNNLEIVLGTNAPTTDGDTLEITIEEKEGEEEKEREEDLTSKETLEIVLGTDAPTVDGETLEITIEEGEGEGDTQSNKYLESVAEGARGVLNFVSDKTSAALSGAVAAAKGAADTAAKCTTDRAADATRKALEYQAPIKTDTELRRELEVDAQLEELKNQIKDNVADAGELFVDNAKKMANTVATYVNPFKGVASNATNNLLMSQNINPPVQYLNIRINPGIDFNPKMLNKNTSNADVHFNPLIKYSERVINDVPVGQPKTEIYEKFFNNNSFNIMLANTLRGLFGQTPKTIDEATDAGIVDDNIVSTLNTLFATGNVIYINNSPYTIYTYSWNGEWQIDSKMPRNLDYITGMSSSSYRDPEQMERYRERQNAATQKELKQKGIGEKYRMSRIMRERLMEDAKQREALQKEQDAKTTAIINKYAQKNAEDAAANNRLTDKQTKRDNRNKELNLRKNALINFASTVVPELKKEVMKAALNAIVSHKQFIRATQEERDIEIDPLTISLFYPTDDLLEAMLEKTKLSQDYAKFVDTHKELIKIIEEYDAAEMEMYETKTKMDNMYATLTYDDDKKEEIINDLLKGKNLKYDVKNLVAPTFTHVANLFGALSETNPPVTPPAIGGGFNIFKGKQVSPEPPTFETIIDSTKVDLDNSNNNKENAEQTEIVKYLSKQIVTTFYKDISDLRTMVTRFQQMLETMVELTKKQYASQSKYYKQYVTFLDKLEQASNQTKENVLFLMCIRQDKTSYAQMLKKLIAFDMDKMQIPETIDATNYYKNNSLMGIDSTYFTTFIAQILKKRYSVSNQLWEISSNSALKAHNEFKTLNETYNLNKYNELFKSAQQPAANPKFVGMFDNVGSDSPNFWGAELTNRYAEYKQYKKQRDDLEVVKDGPNNMPALITAPALFQGDQTEFKSIYDEYDSKEAREKRFKTMFIDVALAEIATLRKITFLTQSIHAADIEIYKCMLNEELFKKHAENCKQTPAVNSAFFNVTCDQSKLYDLVNTNKGAKTFAAQQKQDATGQLTLLSDNQNDMFAELFPIDNNEKLEKMCNQAAVDVTTLFEVTTFKQFMEGNGWSNDCAIKELNDEFITKVFKLSMLNEMFKFNFGSNPKKVPQSVYQNTNYWDLFCLTGNKEEDDLNKLLDAVSMILNAEMHLTSSTIVHNYVPKGKFDLKNNDRIKKLLSSQTSGKYQLNDQLAILYQIFKIKFTIIEITYEQPLDIKLSITGCTNRITKTIKGDSQDEEFLPDEVVKQIEKEEKLTTFAFIIKCKNNYYIPYNSKIGTLLCSVKHLKSVGLDILLWSNCSSESQRKKKYAPPSWLKMYQTIDAVQQRGGADTETDLKDANLKDLSNPNETTDKTIEKTTKENTKRNAGAPLKSALKKTVNQVMQQNNQGASADTVNFYDKYRVNQTYSRDSKLSYYVAIDLVMVPGTSISLAQKAKLKCQMKSDNIRKTLSQIFGTIYVPTPIFITTSEEYAKSKTEEERNRIIQYYTVTDLVNEKKMNNLKGRDFINAMREAIPRSNRFKNAFTHLRIASGEYNSILKNHDITIEELNSLITDANYQRNFMGGRSKKATRAGRRLRKTRKPSRRF